MPSDEDRINQQGKKGGGGEPTEIEEPVDDDNEPVVTEIEEPVPADEPETVEAGGPWARLPAGVIAAIALLALAGFGTVIWWGWDFVVTRGERAERQDWEQLSGLIDRVDNLALFVLGAVFGVAVQARQTADAKVAATKNKAAAQEQHRKVKRNENAARKNERAARGQAKLVGRTAGILQEVTNVVDEITRDDATKVVRGAKAMRAVREDDAGETRFRLDAAGPDTIVAGDETLDVDPRLAALRDDVDEVLREVRSKTLR